MQCAFATTRRFDDNYDPCETIRRAALDPINASAAAHRQPFRAPSPSPSFAASSCGSLYNRPIAKEDLFDDAETPPGGEQGSGANSPATRVQPSASSPQSAIGGYGRPPTSRRRFHRLDSRSSAPWLEILSWPAKSPDDASAVRMAAGVRTWFWAGPAARTLASSVTSGAQV